jgi:hypothetical protein
LTLTSLWIQQNELCDDRLALAIDLRGQQLGAGTARMKRLLEHLGGDALRRHERLHDVRDTGVGNAFGSGIGGLRGWCRRRAFAGSFG